MDLIPQSKFDLETAERAVAAGWPAVEPVLPQLLEWLQDYNWPVARVLAPFLASIGEPIVSYLRPILAGDDPTWSYWVVVAVVAEAPFAVVEGLRRDLERLVESPSPREVEEELPAAARSALRRLV